MATLPQLKVALINSLNKLNNKTVNSEDVSLASFNVDGVVADVVLKGGPSKRNYGEIAIRAKLIDLADLFTKLDITYQAGDDCEWVSELVPIVQTQIGFSFPEEVFEEAPVSWVGTKGVAVLRAKPGNHYFAGEATIGLRATSVDIGTFFTRNYFSATIDTLTEESVIKLIESVNQRAYPRDQFVFSAPMSIAEAGESLGSYNSVIQVTGKSGSGYKGKYNIFYNRIDLADYGTGFSLPDEFAGTIHEALEYETLGIRSVTPVSELQDGDIDYSKSPLSFTLQAVANSYRVFNGVEVSLKRFKDDTKTVTLNFSTNRTTMTLTTISDMCKAIVPKAGRLLLDINVASGVYLVGNKVTDYGLAIMSMPQYGEVILTLNNQGIISGRGQKGASNGSLAAAGPGLFIDPQFRGTVLVNNLGKITGGGGGGGQSTGLKYVGGGGGQPLGAVSDTGSTGNFVDGYAATIAAPAPAREVFQSGTLYYAGGAGGELGQPGKVPYQRNGNPPLYSYGLSTEPGEPGKAVVDEGGKIKWGRVGEILPPLVDYIALLDDWASDKGAVPISDAVELDLLSASGRYMVQLDPSSFYYTDRNGWTLARKLQVVGPVWKGPVARTLSSCILGVALLGCENENVFYWLRRNGLRIYVEFEATTSRIIFSSTNRNLSSTGQLDSTVEQCRVVRVVYYDAYRGKLMDVNPFVGTVKEFSGLVTDLSKANGELDTFS